MKPFFPSGQTIITAAAPGRLDVMGGIADYSGSWVLQMPIREQTTVQIAQRSDRLLRVHSVELDQTFTFDSRSIPLDYGHAREALIRETGGDWAAYVVGCLIVLVLEKNIPLQGLDIQVQSEVPIGKGLSSSAALEVATLRALAQLYNLDFRGTELAVLAQKAENYLAGSPCGLMDQLASCFGQAGSLLPIQCQPDRLFSPIPVPAEVNFLGLDSGVRHAVSGASYTDVRTAAYMGYSMIAQAEGCSLSVIRGAKTSGVRSGLPFGGYLCNISTGAFDQRFRTLLPESLTGSAFLSLYGDTIDPVTTVQPGQTYPVRAATAHPVFENARVQRFAALLKGPNGMDTWHELGALMLESHQSYSACGLGHARTDELVELVCAAGPAAGLFGAKITGGGNGGTVCVLCQGTEGIATARALFEGYRKRHGERLRFIVC